MSNIKNFDNYVCDGQLTLWDLFTERKEKVCERKADDSVCEGCKWRSYKARELEVDEHGQTWVYKCPGTACANWRHGTPLNLSHKDTELQEDNIYCYNRDFLPELKNLIPMIESEFDIRFTEYTDFRGRTAYKYKYRKTEFEIHDSEYNTGDKKQGKRFVSTSWSYAMGGFSMPCDNLKEVMGIMESGFKHADKIEKEKKKNDKTRV